MPIRVTLDKPESVVRDLVQFAAEHVGANLESIQVNVKNSRKSYVGRAYDGVPPISPAAKLPSVKYLVTIGIGPDTKFPIDNIVSKVKWLPEGTSHSKAISSLAEDQSLTVKMIKTPWGDFMARYGVVRREAYGGKSGPIITFSSWDEAIIGVASHEFQHIVQYKNNLLCGEIKCEKVSLDCLNAYRSI